MPRILLLLCAALAVVSAADRPVITADTLHGTWIVDAKALKPEQKAAADTAKTIEGYGVTCTLRTCRVTLSADDQYAGMWRVENATADAATIVVQPRGGEERRLPISYDGKRLVVTDSADQLPLTKAPR